MLTVPERNVERKKFLSWKNHRKREKYQMKHIYNYGIA